MSIIKLKKFCEQMKPQQNSGKLLLEHEANGFLVHFLDTIPDDIKCIEWSNYIQQYFSRNFFKNKGEAIWVTEKQMNTEMKVEIFLKIMSQFDEIVNKFDMSIDDITNIEETQSSLKKLFNLIDEEFNMSQIMDTVFNLKQQKTYLDKIKQSYECKHKQCNILESIVIRRKNGIQTHKVNINTNSELSFNLQEVCMKELLESVHIRLFHPQEHYRNRLPNRAGTDVSELVIEIENDKQSQNAVLFQDALGQNSTFEWLRLFCEMNEYDSEALYYDIFLDQDEQSNVHQHCTKIDHYTLLKERLSIYKIH
eukprot:101225_1